VGLGIPHYVYVGANASDSEGAAGRILAASRRSGLLARVTLKARQARALLVLEKGCAATAVKARRAWTARRLRLHCVVAGGKCGERHPQQAAHQRASPTATLSLDEDHRRFQIQSSRPKLPETHQPFRFRMPSLTWKGRKGLREELLCGGFLGARSQMLFHVFIWHWC
jgi:hypothetical protein